MTKLTVVVGDSESHGIAAAAGGVDKADVVGARCGWELKTPCDDAALDRLTVDKVGKVSPPFAEPIGLCGLGIVA